MKRLLDPVSHHAGLLALSLCALSVMGFGAALDGYSQLQHPVALLGARGMPHAAAFNLLGFVLPGVLAAWAAVGLRGPLPGDASWAARIGARLLLLSAFAFAAQGWFPLDPDDLDGPISQWHATAWTLWWIAAGAGALSIAAGLLRRPGWRIFACAALIASVLIVVLSLSPPESWPAGVAQRIALGAWLGLLVFAGRASEGAAHVSRGAASSPGSSPPARR